MQIGLILAIVGLVIAAVSCYHHIHAHHQLDENRSTADLEKARQRFRDAWMGVIIGSGIGLFGVAFMMRWI